ncbi:MAG: guanine deaminase [Burkholderiales bacterium]|nr:guanine deaminase [Nitrosomonas sp.]MCP5275759.1 guanine deaminase [Burkholderiales bacterium]
MQNPKSALEITGDKPKAVRGAIFFLTNDPGSESDPLSCYQFYDDGILVLQNDGHILDVGSTIQIRAKHHLESHEIIDFSGKFILPGFIDTHTHYAQSEIIATYGEQLVQWLEHYAYPVESQFADNAHAQLASRFFLNELLRNGTTTALVFGTVHKASIDALFAESEKLNMRIIGGKVMMDRNAPVDLLDTPETAYTDSKTLIEAWHNKGRIQYAITPRFAVTSSPEQLVAAAKLYEEYDDVFLQTHVAENLNEVALVKQLFPKAESYLHIYDNFGLIGPRTVYVHGVHLTDDEFDLLARKNAALSFCPTSNLFLGSGLFNFRKAEHHKIQLSLGTDIGAGTSYSMFQTMNEAYKVVQLQKTYAESPENKITLTPYKAFYLATLGAARALNIDKKLGSLAPGMEGDFIVLNPEATPLLRFRMQNARSLADRLFTIMMLADDRAVYAVYVMGRRWTEKTTND